MATIINNSIIESKAFCLYSLIIVIFKIFFNTISRSEYVFDFEKIKGCINPFNNFIFGFYGIL
jgi:hypothetical protein